MRVLFPDGFLGSCTGITPCVETRVTLNGKVKIEREKAQDLSVKPTAFVLQNVYDLTDVFCGMHIYIGNVASSKVLEILNMAAEKNYIDLSELEFQEYGEILDEPVLDGGKGKAYSSREFGFCMPEGIGIQNNCYDPVGFRDDDDCESEGIFCGFNELAPCDELEDD